MIKRNVKVPRWSKKTNGKRAWCRKKLNQVFFHLNRASIKKSIRYSQLVIIIIGLTPISAFSMTPVMLVGDPSQVAEKAEKACTLLCQLAVVGDKFIHTKEGKTAIMWLGYYGAVYSAKSLGLLATPMLGQSAALIAFICSTTYGISTLVGSEAIGQSEFLQTANHWCFKTYVALFGAAGLPPESISLDRGIEFLQALKSYKN